MNPKQVLKLELSFEQESVLPGVESEIHLVARVDPLQGGIEAERPSISVVFVLDVSGSMTGPPLAHVIEASCSLIDRLEEADQVAVVAFADNATEVAGLGPMTKVNKARVKRRLRRLEAGGCTSIEAGMRIAKHLLPERHLHERQLMILLSDGQPNRGISDPPGLARLAESFRPDIAISTLGFGPHHDEDVLSAISDAGSGVYSYIANPLECSFELGRALGAQGDIVADALEILLRPEEGVEILQILSHQRSRFGAEGLLIPLSDALEGRPQFLVAKLSLSASQPPGSWRGVLEVCLRYRVAGMKEQMSLRERLSIPIEEGTPKRREEIWARVLLARGEEARREARLMADRGAFEGAAAVLRKIIKEMEATPGYEEGDGSDLSEALEQLLDEVMAYERKPKIEEYKTFRRMSMGMDLQAGGTHASDWRPQSSKSIAIQDLMLNALPEAYLLGRTGFNAGQRYPLKGEISLGRTSANDIMIGSPRVSRRHARILGREGRYMISDLGSTNPTLINGQILHRPHLLRSGDEICLGEEIFIYIED